MQASVQQLRWLHKMHSHNQPGEAFLRQGLSRHIIPEAQEQLIGAPDGAHAFNIAC